MLESHNSDFFFPSRSLIVRLAFPRLMWNVTQDRGPTDLWSAHRLTIYQDILGFVDML